MTHLADTTNATYAIGHAELEAIEQAVGIITQELIVVTGADTP